MATSGGATTKGAFCTLSLSCQGLGKKIASLHTPVQNVKLVVQG